MNYWKLVNKVIKDSDILLIVLDGRMPELSRHREIERKIKKQGKLLLYVLNKSDLADKKKLMKKKKELAPCVFVSSKERLGSTRLFKKILELSKGKPCSVGVLGYPNVGKSSVINMLSGRKSASVSPHAGHTKGLQVVKARGKLRLIDTPGVLPFGENDLLKEVILGSKNPEHLKEPEYFAMKIVETSPELFERYYGIRYNQDSYDFIEKAAEKSKVLIKGGLPDIQRFSRQLLYDWQRGKIHANKDALK